MAAEDLEFFEWERSKISNQDMNMLKKLGLAKKDETLIFPSEESFPTPRIGYRLHQLTPNSILHISIFITLCECFLGIPPNWGLWKRIFFVRRNSSHNIAYNVGGVVICVRPDVEYFDVKFPDSVQGWRKRWLYIREEHINSQDYNIAPFDGSEKILRRRSWDAEAIDEEKTATDALMKRIHELQNTRGKELSGIQITAYFLRIRVQPLQVRKNPLWMYAGDKDADRISKDLSVKDLEKLVRRILSLSKKDSVPTSYRVEPYSGTNALPKNHQIISSLPPLPEGGEVDERTVVTDDSQGPSRPESEVAGSHKSAASSDKEPESEASKSARSPPSAASPKNKRKRGETEDSGTSKISGSPVEEASPKEEGAFDPYADALISSGEEEEEPAANVTAPTSMSQTLVLSETRRATEEARLLIRTWKCRLSPAPEPKRARIELGEEQGFLAGISSTPSLDDPLMKHFISLGTQFIGYRDTVEDLKGKMGQDFELQEPEGDRLLDALSLLEINRDLACRSIADARTAFTRLFPYFFPKKKQPDAFSDLAKHFIPEEDLGLAFRQENLKIGVEGTMALVAESQQNIDWARTGETKRMNKEKWQSLIKAAKPHSKKILSFLG
ncbi:hypothetical protein QYE76_000151 [Lolium multiflorum]|uniref:Transposase (putative) gypsy type domain-containing protein n=1 Tax=Lolium multiflorum TaxID=4521 RepID=A0AAD8RH01_LOLMU|nr:hypothetical protein QYE76_000151 [Lolium multiflorum]